MPGRAPAVLGEDVGDPGGERCDGGEGLGEKGVVSAVSPGSLITTVQPAARAGPRARTVSMSGEFHGEMMPTTPSGSGLDWKYWPGATSAARPTFSVRAVAAA